MSNESDYKWALEVIEKFYTKDSDLYNLLILHSKQVADLSVAILDKHPEIKADPSFVYRAAMLHDIGVIKTDASGIFCNGTYPYICHGYLGADMLRSIGLDDYALVAERHTGTGLTINDIKERNLPLPADRIYTPQSIEESIICYADKFYSKSKPSRAKTTDEVRHSLSKWGDSTLQRFEQWHSMFSL
ncbi:MAG: HDIG domain-containing protein [Paludibacteraceae bacterium]|nr:HDIG domain-containing protein [Paludibacteraceae bacterium]